MTKGILVAMMATTLTFSQAFSCDMHGKGGFAPENNLQIAVGDKAANNMTKELFLDAITRVSSAYEPIVAQKDGKLIMNNRWDDNTVNASAQQSGKNWQVNMYGGLARHPLVTVDGFMMVVCHELGHHIGGAPRKGGFGSSWASNEGQADYFAGLKCMRRVLENEDNISAIANMTIDADVVTQCSSVYKSESEIALCKRVSMAGKSLAMLLGDLGGNSNVKFNTPDVSKVAKTNDNHPQAQCRLDTYFQGSLCDKAISDDVDNRDAIKGTCVKKDGYTVGVRPLCWYKPGANEI
ncbi:MAG: hypothetical protein HOP07_06210 [Bacteriovoracaceae bacterium]|nr:hypothetical protein [Bacteriovoracaceae bacterium]